MRVTVTLSSEEISALHVLAQRDARSVRATVAHAVREHLRRNGCELQRDAAWRLVTKANPSEWKRLSPADEAAEDMNAYLGRRVFSTAAGPSLQGEIDALLCEQRYIAAVERMATELGLNVEGICGPVELEADDV